MKRLLAFWMTVALVFAIACGGGSGTTAGGDPDRDHGQDHADGDHDHDHDHDHAHGADDQDHAGHFGDDHDHDHEVEPLGTVAIGDLEVELAQGHGPIAAGEESHLVVKLPYSDDGETTVRAWLGVEDRTLSHVGRGEYAASHGDYDIHAIAPDPLPEGVMWWVEIEKPDGTTSVGSAQPQVD